MKRRTSIGKVFDTYTRTEVVAAGLSTNTMEGYRNTRRLVVGFFGDVPIENLDAESILRFREHLLSWQKPDTVRSHICQLRSILRWCRRKKMEVMDVEDIRVPKREKRAIVYLTEPEIEEFITVVGQRRRG